MSQADRIAVTHFLKQAIEYATAEKIAQISLPGKFEIAKRLRLKRTGSRQVIPMIHSILEEEFNDEWLYIDYDASRIMLIQVRRTDPLLKVDLLQTGEYLVKVTTNAALFPEPSFDDEEDDEDNVDTDDERTSEEK